VLDNVYMLGRPGNRPLDEDTPHPTRAAVKEKFARVLQSVSLKHIVGAMSLPRPAARPITMDLGVR
jgi:hypothetical protein